MTRLGPTEPPLGLAARALAAARFRLPRSTPSRNCTPGSRARRNTSRTSAQGHPFLSTASAKASFTSFPSIALPMSVAARKRRRGPAGTPAAPTACPLTTLSSPSPAKAPWLVYARSANAITHPDAPTRWSDSSTASAAGSGQLVSSAAWAVANAAHTAGSSLDPLAPLLRLACLAGVAGDTTAANTRRTQRRRLLHTWSSLSRTSNSVPPCCIKSSLTNRPRRWRARVSSNCWARASLSTAQSTLG